MKSIEFGVNTEYEGKIEVGYDGEHYYVASVYLTGPELLEILSLLQEVYDRTTVPPADPADDFDQGFEAGYAQAVKDAAPPKKEPKFRLRYGCGRWCVSFDSVDAYCNQYSLDKDKAVLFTKEEADKIMDTRREHGWTTLIVVPE